MNAKRTLVLSLIAGLLATSPLVASAADSKKMPEQAGRPDRETMREEMRSFREAVKSGALTDAELLQLKKAREAAHAQMKKIHDDLKTLTEQLINNKDRTAKRDKWPEGLIGPEHMGRDMMKNDHERHGAPDAN